MHEPVDIARELAALEAELKRLEVEYTMFFAGRLPHPPWETRGRVEAMVRRLDQSRPSNYGDRFRLQTLQARLSTFIDLWDRAQRAREEGRPGPFQQPQAQGDTDRRGDRDIRVATLRDPVHDIDTVRALYRDLAEARRETGEDVVSFQRFASLVRTQMVAMKASGCEGVAFRVAVKEGKVAFTARGVRSKR